MIQAPLRFYLAAISLLSLLSGWPLLAQSDAPVDNVADAKIEQRTFLLINTYRAQNNFPPLKWDDAIAQAARAHSHDMASGEVDFGHDGFSDRVRALKTVIVGIKGAGENVFMSDQPDQIAEMAVQTWLKSPHHLENIRGSYTLSGIGISTSSRGQIYFTQLFLKVEKEASPATP